MTNEPRDFHVGYIAKFGDETSYIYNLTRQEAEELATMCAPQSWNGNATIYRNGRHSDPTIQAQAIKACITPYSPAAA